MKTITRKETNVSLYLYEDGVLISINDNYTTVGIPPELIISDCKTDNANLYAGLTAPADWVGWKYLYTPETGWQLNPDWVPPEPPQS